MPFDRDGFQTVIINALSYDRHEEEVAANTFARNIRAAATAVTEDLRGTIF